MTKYPAIFRVHEDGVALTFGNRREYCPNNPIYHDYTRRLEPRLWRLGRDPAAAQHRGRAEPWPGGGAGTRHHVRSQAPELLGDGAAGWRGWLGRRRRRAAARRTTAVGLSSSCARRKRGSLLSLAHRTIWDGIILAGVARSRRPPDPPVLRDQADGRGDPAGVQLDARLGRSIRRRDAALVRLAIRIPDPAEQPGVQEGIDSGFVFSFVQYQLPHRGEPRQDLDLASYGIVKVDEDRFGDTYPDMAWEPKAAFTALANYYHG